MFLFFSKKEKVPLDSLAKSLLLMELSQGFGWFDVSRFDPKRILSPAEVEALRASLADFFVVLVYFLLLDRLVSAGPQISPATFGAEFCDGAVSAYMAVGLSTDEAATKVNTVLVEQGYLNALNNEPEPLPGVGALLSSIPESARKAATELLHSWQEDAQEDAKQAGPFYQLCRHFAKRTVEQLSGNKDFDAPRSMIAFQCAYNLYRSTQAGVIALLKKINVTLPPYQT